MKRLLIVGGGGMGERHLRVFGDIPGVEVSVCEPREERLAMLKQNYQPKNCYQDYRSLELHCFDAVIVCTPTHLHVEMAKHAALQGCSLLIEKPLAVSLKGCEELLRLVEERRIVAGAAYVLRHFQPYMEMKHAIDSGLVGEVRTITVEGGQYFPDIRPDYAHNYFSRYATGGGVLLDFMSHGANLLEWFIGRETEVSCLYDRLQLRDIETDDVGFITARYVNGSICHLQQDAFRRDYFSHVTIVGSEATLLFEYERGRMGHFAKGAKEWRWKEYAFVRDDMFRAQAESFITALDGKEPVRCSLPEAEWTLCVILAARQSAQDRRHVFIHESGEIE